MSESLTDQKASLRRRIRAELIGIPLTIRAMNSVTAGSLLESQLVWKRARAILFYAPLPEELDVWPIIANTFASDKMIALPRFDPVTKSYVAGRIQNLETDIRSGQFGIREPATHCAPISLARLDLVLVPGVAFDMRGHRLGRGKGFYDRLLAPVRAVTCGVGFDEQIVSEIPVEPHDIRLNYLLTPTRWIKTQEST